MIYAARALAVVSTLLLLVPSDASAAERADTTLTLGARPTVVAFFGLPMSIADSDPDVAQVVADLHFFLKDTRPALDSVGVDVHEVYDTAVRLRGGGREWELPMRSGLPVGYYFWAPSGPAYVCRGVRRDADLLAILDVYLAEVRGGAAGKLAQCDPADR